MKILAIEFSSHHRSVALIDAGEGGRVVSRAGEVVVRSTRALYLVERVLAAASVDRAAVEAVAVGVGPGSYTGIRAAISLAQGWELARGVKVAGVSSVEALAAQAMEEGVQGVFWIVVDAHRNEFYIARCVNDGLLRRTEDLRLATREQVDDLATRGEQLLGPGVDRLVAGGRDLVPQASMVGLLAARAGVFVPSQSLEPVYLRETQFVKAAPARWAGG